MKHIALGLLISSLIALTACESESNSNPQSPDAQTPDTTSPVLIQVMAVPTPISDTTPSYTFHSSEAGTITYGGICASATTLAVSGDNTISFNTLSEGVYSDCSITVTDAADNTSNTLTVESFTIDFSAPTLAQVMAVITPASDTTPSYTFSSSEAGVIVYGGSCASETTEAVSGDNTISFNTLAEGVYSNCTITVSDVTGHVSAPLSVNSFTIDFSAPTLTQVAAVITPASDATPSYTFHSSEAGTISYGGACASATTSAVSGNNTVTFNALAEGIYNDCTITISDVTGHVSAPLSVNSFTIDYSAPVLSQVTSVITPASDTTPSYTFNSSEAGTIVYGGACASATTVAVSGDITVTFNALAEGVYSNCTITVKDAANNSSSALTVKVFTIVAVQAPMFSSLWPAALFPGYEMKLSGFDLAEATVTINGSLVTPTFQNEHEIKFIAPDLPVGDYDMDIENAVGNITVTASVQTPLLAQYVDAGDFHNCAVQVNGTVQCWGGNWYGQLGDGTTVNSTVPITVMGIATAVAVAAGSVHSCALLLDGTIKCWGYNAWGQLGDGATANSAVPVIVNGITQAKAISVDNNHSCALLLDGTVKCWGANYSGQLGNGSTTNSPIPVIVSGITNAISINVGKLSSCAVLVEGAIKCWGYNAYGQLGDGTTTDSTTPVIVNGISNAIKIGITLQHSCALLLDGAVKCWGINFAGQLGDGTSIDSVVPVSVSGVTNAVSLSVGQWRSCVVLAEGVIRCWGFDRSGELAPIAVAGIDNALEIRVGDSQHCALLLDGKIKCWGWDAQGQLNSHLPVTISSINTVVGVAAGSSHICSMLFNGAIQCWGANWYGLGDGTTTNSIAPVNVSGVTTAEAISIGSGHSCTLLSVGAMKCWGANYYGQLGDGTTTDSTVPITVNGITTAVAINAGYYHSCAVLSDGAVKCWGANYYGQLGNGTTTDSTVPITVNGITTAVAISAGSSHSCALLSGGAVKCWGSNYFGQLGNGTTTNSTVPITVNGITTAVAISAGHYHNCVLLSDGTVKCWGLNDDGEVGDGTAFEDGTSTNSTVPTTVNGITTAVAISAGGSHSCALISGGAVKCWGNNFYGQLGDGTGVSSSTPTTVQNLKHVEAIYTGRFNTCALLSDGFIQCWGKLSGVHEITPGLPVYTH